MAIAMDVAEATFYDDDAMKRLKSKMTLDFNSGKSRKGLSSVLNSPDLQLLKLASPELERMIIQHNGMVTTTPTPTTQFGGSQPKVPIDVTEEQEAYAKGFVDALAELHQNQPGQIPTSLSAIMTLAHQTLANQQAAVSAQSQVPVNFTTTTSLPGGAVIPQQVPSVSSSNMAIPSRLLMQPQRTVSPLARTTSPVVMQPHPKLLQVKEESDTQMVPSLGLTPPVSPICMESQERIKLDRKRARNRVAARKCRTRKLERISRLEERVADLKGQNCDLQVTATDLRTEVCRLKQQIMEHVNSGCQVMLSQNLL